MREPWSRREPGVFYVPKPQGVQIRQIQRTDRVDISQCMRHFVNAAEFIRVRHGADAGAVQDYYADSIKQQLYTSFHIIYSHLL